MQNEKNQLQNREAGMRVLRKPGKSQHAADPPGTEVTLGGRGFQVLS